MVRKLFISPTYKLGIFIRVITTTDPNITFDQRDIRKNRGCEKPPAGVDPSGCGSEAHGMESVKTSKPTNESGCIMEKGTSNHPPIGS